MNWSDVGNWIKSNASDGGKLIGSLITGNVPSAIAAGVAMVSGVTGTNDPEEALKKLQEKPELFIKLKEIELKEGDSIRRHIEAMAKLDIESHSITQETIKNGDRAEDRFVRWTRPGQSWVSLGAAVYYALYSESPNFEILLLLTLPWAYAGLRQFGKGIDSLVNALPKKAVKNG